MINTKDILNVVLLFTSLLGHIVFNLSIADGKNLIEHQDVLINNSSKISLEVVVSANPDTICLGESTHLNAIVTGGSGFYTYSWNSNPPGFTSNIENPSDSPQQTTEYTLAVFDGLNYVTDQIIVVVDSLPTVFNVTGGGIYCVGSGGVSVRLDGSEVNIEYTLIFNGMFTQNTLQGTGVPIDFGVQADTGKYTVYAQNLITNCTTYMAGSADVAIKQLPAIYNVIGGGHYCSGGTGKTIGINGSETDVIYELFINGVTTGDSINGNGIAIYFGNQTTAGTYTVVGTNDCGDTNMNGDAVIYIDPLPKKYNMTGGGSYCAGDSGIPVYLNGSELFIDYYLLRNGILTGNIMSGNGDSLDFGIQSAGDYTIIAINPTSFCISNMNGNSVIIKDTLPAAFNVTGGGSYCGGGLGIEVGLDGSEKSLPYELFRNYKSTGNIIQGTGLAISFGMTTSSGNYTVIATNNCGISDMHYFANVQTDSLPTAYAGQDNAVCLGDCTTLNASGGIYYNWNNNETTASINICPTQTTTYIVTVTAVNGCTDSDEVIINVNPLPIVFAGSSATMCLGDSTSIGNTAIGGTLPYSFLWSNGSTNLIQSVSPTSSTTFTITVTDANSCIDRDEVIITVNPPPNVYAGSDTSICKGNSTPIGNTATGGTSPYSYLWSNGSTDATQSVSPTITTNYTFTVTDANSCTDSDEVIVTVNPVPSVYTGSDTSICKGNSTSIGNNASGGTSPYSYLWSNGSTDANQSIIPTSTTNYTVTVTDANNCTNSDVVTVNVNPLPSVYAGADTSICNGNSASIGNIATGGTSPYKYLWSNNSTVATLSVDPIITTTFVVIVTDVNSCTASDDVTVIVNPLPDPKIVGDSIVCANQWNVLYRVKSPSDEHIYKWQVNNGTIITDTFYNNMSVHWNSITNGTGFIYLYDTIKSTNCGALDIDTVFFTNNIAPDTATIFLKGTSILICSDTSVDSYQWGYDIIGGAEGIEFPNATNQFFYSGNIPLNTDLYNYWVITGYDNGCYTKSYYRSGNFTYGIPRNGSELISSLEIDIYPNPSNDYIYIEINDQMPGEIIFTFWNIYGKCIREDSKIKGAGISKYTFKEFEPGIYLVKTMFNNKLNLSKIIIIN